MTSLLFVHILFLMFLLLSCLSLTSFIVPNTPSVGYTQQLLYFFTGLEPVSQDVILQPVVWYGVSPKGGMLSFCTTYSPLVDRPSPSLSYPSLSYPSLSLTLLLHLYLLNYKGGDGWYAACWEVHSDNSVIVSNVVRVCFTHTCETRIREERRVEERRLEERREKRSGRRVIFH